MQTQDMLLEVDNFALVTYNEQNRLPSLIWTRGISPRKMLIFGSFNQFSRVYRQFNVQFEPRTSNPSVSSPSAPHVLLCACTRACARDAPNVYPRIRALVTALPSARHRATKRLPARPTPPRVPDTVTAHLVVHSKPSRVHYRPSKDSTEPPDSLTLPRLFPHILRLGKLFST
ncbi:hypothetical protein CRG98_012134 [Punica granatum]|uniref:Uncharacterized protein n=1 Tax=Punica granatum TaxID=22663 RepID=A0A2I0KGW5_PUNGR|nr:hypothetical protein CRG98_012134 [Punica granatum]